MLRCELLAFAAETWSPNGATSRRCGFAESWGQTRCEGVPPRGLADRGRGVIVRPMGGYGLGDTLRITVGSRIETQRLLDALT